MALIPVYEMDFPILAPTPRPARIGHGVTARDMDRCQCGHDARRHSQGHCESCLIKHKRDHSRVLCNRFKPSILECKSCGLDRHFKEIDANGNCRFSLASDRCKRMRGWNRSA